MSDAEVAPGVASAGALIRAAREKQGLHIAALAAAIKVTPRKLDALEHDRWSELPDATFTRALAQTVCRTLKIDAKPVLALLPAAGPAALDPLTSTLQTPFRERASRDTAGLSGLAIRPLVVAAVVLMLAAVAVYLLPDTLWRGWSTSSAVTSPIVTETLSAQPAGSSAEGLFPPTDAAASAADSAASTALLSPAPSTLSAEAGAPLVVAIPRPDSPVPAAAATPGASLAQLSVSGTSWVEAREAGGAVVLSRTLMAGESVGLDGKLPMRLTIGNASATQLVFKGQRVDLTSGTRDNVARVELR